jgi:DNA-binding XRE family transcriptional regulator
MGGTAAEVEGFLRMKDRSRTGHSGNRLAGARRVLRLGKDSHRGSFDALIVDIERAQAEDGEEPTVSSAAFRAGQIIRMFRKGKGMSQAMLARRLGVTQARISELEAGLGPRGPSWDLMERIANACDATILVSPPSSDIAFDAAEPSNAKRYWAMAGEEG